MYLKLGRTSCIAHVLCTLNIFPYLCASWRLFVTVRVCLREFLRKYASNEFMSAKHQIIAFFPTEPSRISAPISRKETQDSEETEECVCTDWGWGGEKMEGGTECIQDVKKAIAEHTHL